MSVGRGAQYYTELLTVLPTSFSYTFNSPQTLLQTFPQTSTEIIAPPKKHIGSAEKSVAKSVAN